MFFVVRSSDSFNFPLGLIKYIVIVIVNSNMKDWDLLTAERNGDMLISAEMGAG